MNHSMSSSSTELIPEPTFPIPFKEVWRRPLPLQERKGTRLINRTVVSLAHRYLVSVEGMMASIHPDNDPFILIMNHNQRYESVIVPNVLIYYRGGKLLHFMADWNFMLMPGVATLYRRSGVILVDRKDAKPKFLNVLKPLYKQDKTAFERAADRLREGGSVGIFPEGTVNRDPERLMRGLPGAAKLALETGVKVVPVGIRFPHNIGNQPIKDGAKMSLHVGASIEAPTVADPTDLKRDDIRAFHAQIMTSLAQLSGKSWHPEAQKRRRYVL
jgi:1-acyl-sn-glycerol-3-phosphate acyltransferase